MEPTLERNMAIWGVVVKEEESLNFHEFHCLLCQVFEYLACRMSGMWGVLNA